MYSAVTNNQVLYSQAKGSRGKESLRISENPHNLWGFEQIVWTEPLNRLTDAIQSKITVQCHKGDEFLKWGYKIFRRTAEDTTPLMITPGLHFFDFRQPTLVALESLNSLLWNTKKGIAFEQCAWPCLAFQLSFRKLWTSPGLTEFPLPGPCICLTHKIIESLQLIRRLRPLSH